MTGMKGRGGAEVENLQEYIGCVGTAGVAFGMIFTLLLPVALPTFTPFEGAGAILVYSLPNSPWVRELWASVHEQSPKLACVVLALVTGT